jgi:hypothetical protein
MALLELGHNLYLPDNPPAYLAPEALTNTWIIGNNQTGKSALLERLAMQCAYHDIPFTYIDPLSTSMPYILGQIPKRWIPDTVYLDPFSDDIIGWNPLADLQVQQEKVASQMVMLFRKMLKEGSFEGRSQDIMKMSVLALSGLENATFLHIEKLLNDDTWRRLQIVPKLTGSVRRFWETEYEQWIKDRQKSIAIAAPQNKIRIFTTSAILTETLCAKERIAPQEITKGKILLCDLHGFELGEIETTVLSSLLLARISVAVQKPYPVFIDNVEYISPDILKSALLNPFVRLVVAGSDVTPLMKHAKNLFVFQVGEDDAKHLAGEFPDYIQVSLLMKQDPYYCYIKREGEAFEFGGKYTRIQTLEPFASYGDTKTPTRIRRQSRERYARSRTAVREYLKTQGVS